MKMLLVPVHSQKPSFFCAKTDAFSLVWVQDCLLACSKEIWGSNIQVPQNWSQGSESVLLSTALWWFFGCSSAFRECKICKENIFSDKEWLGSTVKKEHLSLFSEMRSTLTIWSCWDFKALRMIIMLSWQLLLSPHTIALIPVKDVQ